MKTILTLAAVAAALATTSIASAHDNPGGHWEWRSDHSFGPRSTVPSRTRVWIKDTETSVANCDCAMMNADHASCMMNMPGKVGAPSAG